MQSANNVSCLLFASWVHCCTCPLFTFSITCVCSHWFYKNVFSLSPYWCIRIVNMGLQLCFFAVWRLNVRERRHGYCYLSGHWKFVCIRPVHHREVREKRGFTRNLQGGIMAIPFLFISSISMHYNWYQRFRFTLLQSLFISLVCADANCGCRTQVLISSKVS